MHDFGVANKNLNQICFVACSKFLKVDFKLAKLSEFLQRLLKIVFFLLQGAVILLQLAFHNLLLSGFNRAVQNRLQWACFKTDLRSFFAALGFQLLNLLLQRLDNFSVVCLEHLHVFRYLVLSLFDWQMELFSEKGFELGVDCGLPVRLLLWWRKTEAVQLRPLFRYVAWINLNSGLLLRVLLWYENATSDMTQLLLFDQSFYRQL